MPIRCGRQRAIAQQHALRNFNVPVATATGSVLEPQVKRGFVVVGTVREQQQIWATVQDQVLQDGFAAAPFAIAVPAIGSSLMPSSLAM